MTTLRWRDTEADAAPQRRYFRPSDGIRLHANEHPYSPPRHVLDAISDWALVANRYPFGNEGKLIELLAERMAIPADQVMLGAGSNELIYKIITALGGPGAETVFPHPSYPTFAAAPAATSGRPVPVPLLDDGACDLKGLLAAVTDSTTCVVVCNPNNPTGGAIPTESLLEFADTLRTDVLLLVDEAYFEYGDEFASGGRGALELFGTGRPVAVTRSFSKFFALAGVRLGYGAMSTGELAGEMRGHLGPNAVSAVALRAGEAALECEPEYLGRLAEQTAERARLAEALRALGLNPLPTQTNFVCCDEPDEGAAAWLAEHGISVRSGQSVGSPGHLRITVGRPEDNALAVELLSDYIAGRALHRGGQS